MNVIEDTVLSDSTKTFQSGNKGGSGTVSCWWDETDTLGQQMMTAGAEVTLNLYPGGDADGDTVFSCSAIVNSIARSAAAKVNPTTSLTCTWLMPAN